MRGRKAEDAEWQAQKHAILDLYVNQNMPLKYVMRIMTERGFIRSKSQYERVLKSKGWATPKNIRSTEWQFIYSRLREREAEGKRSLVKVRGVTISEERLRKEERRQGYLATHERLRLQHGSVARSVNPPDIEINTPPTSPSPVPQVFQALHHKDIPDTEEIPWWKELNLLSPTMDKTQGSYSGLSMTGIMDDMNAQLELQHDPGTMDTIMSPKRLPPELSPRDHPQMQLVRVFKNILSKTLDVRPASVAVLRLSQVPECLPVLRRLLRELPDIPLFKSFAQDLIVPASMNGNVPLLELLVELGLDVNKPYVDQRVPSDQQKKTTALESAVYNRRKDIVEYLLGHGASSWHTEVLVTGGKLASTILDIIIGADKSKTLSHSRQRLLPIDSDIFKVILESRPRGAVEFRQFSLRTVRHAVLQARIDYVDMMFHFIPSLRLEATRNPWILLEAAASIGDASIVQALMQQGLDVLARNNEGGGSALAAAATSSNTALIKDLLVASVDPNIPAYGLGELGSGDSLYPEEEQLRNLHGLAALHIATLRDSKDAVDILLKCGADANLNCGIYPIQIAAANNFVPILKSLLMAGAHCDLVVPSNVTGSALVLKDSSLPLRNIVTSQSALQLAFWHGHMDVVHILYKGGASLRAYRCSGTRTVWDPLHVAIQKGHTELVRFTLDKLYSDASRTYRLSDIARVNVAKELSTVGHLKTRAACQLALMCAAITLRMNNFVKFMLYQMVSVEIDSMAPRCARRALILAIRERQTDLIATFLTAGVSVFDRISLGEEDLFDLDEHYMFWSSVSAFEFAVQHERQEILMIILRHISKDPEANQAPAVQRQLGAAYASTIFIDNYEMQQLALEAGLRVKEIDQTMGKGSYLQCRLYSYLQQAARAGDLEEVQSLLEKHAPLHYPSNDPAHNAEEWTPLQIAASEGHISIVNCLLIAGADVNAPPASRHGRSALQAASENGYISVVRRLLEVGADVNAEACPYAGITAIEGAATKSHLDIVLMLLTRGADIKGRYNENYRNTMYGAWKNGHHKLVQVIQSWKTEKYGAEDCETIEDIVASIEEFGEYEDYNQSENDMSVAEDYDDDLTENIEDVSYDNGAPRQLRLTGD